MKKICFYLVNFKYRLATIALLMLFVSAQSLAGQSSTTAGRRGQQSVPEITSLEDIFLCKAR